MSSPVDWRGAKALFDANFIFRKPESEPGDRWYRKDANGPYLWTMERGGSVLVGLEEPLGGSPEGVAVERENLFSTPGLHCYRIDSMAALEWLVSAFRKAPAVKAPESEPQSTSASGTGPSKENPTMASNIILYGPPGTGKTYATASHAVLLCDGALPGAGDQNAIRSRFEELRQAGRISFVTFHQSFGYEEFVEGLRPHVSDAGQVVYSVRPGVFKSACASALLRSPSSPGISGKPLRERKVFKMSLGASWSDEGTKVFDYCLKNSCILLGWGGDIDFSDCDTREAIERKLKQEAPDIEKPGSHLRFVDCFKREMKIGDLVMVSYGNSKFRGIAEVADDYEFAEDAPFHQMRRVRWLATSADGWSASDLYEKAVVMSTLYVLGADNINWETLQGIVGVPEPAQGAQQHVIIIDEINRANISKVFGELITLIEPDKRAGAPNAVTVRLPYSGEDFSVPSNLHIIGTMNTADRSIALLDTALRRRFDFVEVMPDPALLRGVEIEGVDLEQLLRALNERIEVLYDRDHTIGHAYFLGVTTLSDLEAVFRRKVLPLLQEYFFENWAKVRRVLSDRGDGDFIRRVIRPALAVDDDDGDQGEPTFVYSVNPATFPVQAYQRIYAG